MGGDHRNRRRDQGSPVDFVIYFTARKEWKQIIFLLLGFFAATFLPVLLIGIDKQMEYLHTFSITHRLNFHLRDFR